MRKQMLRFVVSICLGKLTAVLYLLYFDFFISCVLHYILQAMRNERHRQYYLGDKKEHYAAPPREDAF